MIPAYKWPVASVSLPVYVKLAGRVVSVSLPVYVKMAGPSESQPTNGSSELPAGICKWLVSKTPVQI